MTTDHKLSPAELAIRDAAREYHRTPTRGKIAVNPTKPLSNQRDLSLAYSPGVAYPCLDIQADPSKAYDYTSRGNLVAVITNGTAVLGLGDIGPLAGKPVMEGKGCLFKKFAGVDVFDIELDERDPDKLVDIIAAMEPTLGGVNLEDIKAPECFYIEQKLRERMNIPVFHDDQHGTAIISSAALLNGLELVGKKIDEVKVAVSGAGAAALACLDVMVGLGVKREHVFVCDSKGVIYEGRAGGYDESKARYAQKTELRTLADVVANADVFLGCSTAGVLTAAMVKTMGTQPIILALANPEPEIRPEVAKAARPDCIIATGRSDYPNQVNNVLCFPYIFRGALDCGATKITEAMKLACVRQIADLAKADISEEVATAYAGQELVFGPDYLIPTPFDSRLILRIAPAVAKAAADSGVATRPIEDMEAYRQQLSRFVYQTGMFMRPVFAAAKGVAPSAKRVAYAEGEDERVLRAVQVVVDDGLAQPILVGRPAVIEARIKKAGLRLRAGTDFTVVNPEDDPRFKQYWETYHRIMGRNGISMEAAKATVRRSSTTIASLMVKLGDADAMLCGLVGRFDAHLDHVREVIGVQRGATGFATLNALMMDDRTLFIADTYVNEDPDAQHLAEIALMAAEEVQRFGLPPKVAFLSHSMYGSSKRKSALKMRAAHALFSKMAPHIECDGELQGDAALSEDMRNNVLMDGKMHGEANILICPNLDAANILFNVLKMIGGHGVTVGPILLGAAAPAHVLTPSATVRRVVNMTALAAAHSALKKRALERGFAVPRFAANVSLLYTELPFLDRFQAAAQSGFTAVEFLFPYAFSAQDIRQRLDDNGLQLALHNFPPGNWDAGDRGMACDPARVAEFRASVARGLEYAVALGAPQLHCLAGIAPAGVAADALLETYVGNLRYAASACKAVGKRLLIEPINTYDFPGYYLTRTAQALGVLDLVGADNTGLQYDIYHAQRTEGELAATLEKHIQRIAHIQIADNPGRHEPGTGEIRFDFLLALLDRLGYAGWVGCEYRPAGDTQEGLGWLRPWASATST